MYLNFQQYRISPLLTVCNYDYVLMSLTLPDGVKKASLRHEGNELSHMRYDKRVPSGGGVLKGPAVAWEFVPPAAWPSLPRFRHFSATRKQEDTLLGRWISFQFSNFGGKRLVFLFEDPVKLLIHS